jgi:hypothetical protein
MPGSGCNEMVIGLGYGLSSGLISLSPPHGQGTRGCRNIAHGEGRLNKTTAAPLSSELRHHTAYPVGSDRKPLGLNP